MKFQAMFQFSNEQIKTDCGTSGDPLYFAWNNWMDEAIVKRKKDMSAKPRMTGSSASLHVQKQ